MKPLVVFACLVACPLPLAAQYGWTWQHPHPQGSDLFSVAATAPGTAVAVGAFGQVLRTTDGGERVVGIATPPAPVASLVLDQNYPNPFRARTTIGFRVSAGGFTSLRIYDALGREVAAPVNGFVPAGRHVVHWDAGGLAGGIYLGRLESGTEHGTIRLILLK